MGGAVLHRLVGRITGGSAKGACAGNTDALVGRDQGRAALQVVLVQHGRHPLGRQRHEVGVGHIGVAVGVGQALGFGHQVHTHHGRDAAFVGRVCGAVAGEVEVLQNAQRLGDGNATGGGRRHAAHVVAVAVGGADRVTLLGLVGGQVGHGHQAGGDGGLGRIVPHRLFRLGDDVLCDLAGVHGRGALFGEGCQCLGVGHVGHGFASLSRRAIGLEVGGHGIGVQGQAAGIAGDGVTQAAGDLEAIVGQLDTFVEQTRPRHAAMVLVGQLQHAQHAGHTDGAAAAPCAGHWCGRAGVVLVLARQVVAIGGSGSGLAAVVGAHLLGGSIVVQHERAARDGARLRFDQAQHRLHGDGSIHGGAAGLEHIAAGLGGQRGVGYHHVLAGGFGFVAQAVARGGFGRRRVARDAGAHHHGRAAAGQHRAAVGVGVYRHGAGVGASAAG